MMTPLERQQEIERRLIQQLAPSELAIVDESHQHVGHVGAQSGASHFAVVIRSERFAGLSLIQRHQLIYGLLKDLIPTEIHALKIKAFTPTGS